MASWSQIGDPLFLLHEPRATCQLPFATNQIRVLEPEPEPEPEFSMWK